MDVDGTSVVGTCHCCSDMVYSVLHRGEGGGVLIAGVCVYCNSCTFDLVDLRYVFFRDVG